MLLLSSADFFKINFSENSFSNTIRVSNSLGPDQYRHSVGPDMDLNCLKGYQQMKKVATSKERTNPLRFSISLYLCLQSLAGSPFWGLEIIQETICSVKKII